MKVTQSKIKSFLKHKLATDKAWALRALTRIHERQTDAEQSTMSTHDANGVGFSGCDAEILSSFVSQFQQRGVLSDKQMALVFKKMPRYWNQIKSLIDKDTLEKLVVAEIKA